MKDRRQSAPEIRAPFLLPAGNVQVAFSGGRTSAYLLHRLLEVLI